MNPNFIIAYVKDATKSADLYARVLGQKPVQSTPAFAMFALPGGITFGLWACDDAKPAPNGTGGVEIGFPVANDDALHTAAAEWKALGLDIIQPPTRMDFGFTFTATDSDGHRLRAFVPAAA
jgi:catechol 2,3-dioxygenase-like lactoylglutathione lyase family enzyme